MIGSPWMRARDSTIVAASPLWMNPFERAMPPPKRRRMPRDLHRPLPVHGEDLLLPVDREEEEEERPEDRDGGVFDPRKIMSRPGITTPPISLVCSKIQPRAVRVKTMSVHRSPAEIGPSFASSIRISPRALGRVDVIPR
jgi:hypothetical protein